MAVGGDDWNTVTPPLAGLSAEPTGGVTTRWRCASPPVSGRCAVSRYRTLGV